MYQNIFALDEVSFKDRTSSNEAPSEYTLNNYSYYQPKLEKDFYLRVFLKKSLFDIDILELEDFLTFQHENSPNDEKFIKMLKLKILPSIEKIIKNASVSIEGNGGYHKQIKLEGDFIETEDVVKNRNYEFYMFYHKVAIDSLEEDIKERTIIISDYIKKVDDFKINDNPNALTWSGKPSHLAFIIRNLIDEGYITAPLGHDKEINYTELSRQILSSFTVANDTTINTLKVYVNSDSDKHTKLKENFNNQGFHLPNSGFLG